MERDPFEPIAHINREIAKTLTDENERFLYEDTVNILQCTLERALSVSSSPAARWRFRELLEAMDRDIKVCGFTR